MVPSAAHLGNGYATEAAAECLRYGFEEMGRDHVISLIDPLNVASIRVAERIGESVGEYQLGEHRLLVYGTSSDRGLAPSDRGLAPTDR